MTPASVLDSFDTFGIERIAGITDLDNVDSKCALLKSGLVRDSERTLVPGVRRPNRS